MTSFPVGNKTSLSQKPCIPDKKLLSGSHVLFFRIRLEKLPKTTPCGNITMTSYPVCKTDSLSWKPCIANKKLLWITIMKSWSLSNFYKKQQILIQKPYQFIYTFQLTGYATELNEKKYLLFCASDSRH